jgi:cell division protein FtsW
MKRSDRSLFTSWWFQIDWSVMGLVAALCAVGMLAGIASPHLLHKILGFYAAGAFVLFVVPMMPRRLIIAGAAVLGAAALGLFLWTYISPTLIHNSARWVRMGGLSLMPADFMKPAFVVLTAWFLVECKKVSGIREQVSEAAAGDFIGAKNLWTGGWWPVYLALFGGILLMMFFHPDIGNMFMYLAVFAAMLWWLGAKWKYIGGLVALGATAFAAAFSHPHFRARLLGTADSWQTDRSIDAIKNGGWFGLWEESNLFERVPMANTDFVFSGIVEMWGAVFAVLLLAAMFVLFAVLWRRAVESRDDFGGLVIFGAAVFFALHTIMNIMTATGVMMKGTTLPFISYGGSSLLAFCLLFAIVLGVIRQDKWGL